MNTKARIICVFFSPIFLSLTLNNLSTVSYLEIRDLEKIERSNQINLQTMKNLRLYIDYLY